MKNDTESDTSAPISERAGYTGSDAAHFTKLMSFTDTAAPARAQATPVSALPDAGLLTYTESDLREFEKLTASLSRYRRPRQSARSTDALKENAGYTDSDNRLFEKMMPLGRNAAATAPHDAGGTPPAATHAVTYTRKDLEAFGKLAYDRPDDQQDHSDEPDRQRPRNDRNVGAIRIVDSDRENARQRENGRRGNAGMKVRFFD